MIGAQRHNYLRHRSLEHHTRNPPDCKVAADFHKEHHDELEIYPCCIVDRFVG